MGMKPVCIFSGLLLVGLALPGCESCNSCGKGHSGVPNGYASTNPPASAGQGSWNNRNAVQPAAGSTYGQRQPGVTNVPPASPVTPTSTTGAETGLSNVPALPPQQKRGISEKPLSYSEPTIRTTAPPTPEVPPDPEPAVPRPTLPDRPTSPAPPPAFEDRGGPSLTPPNTSMPPVPPPVSRPMPPE